MKLKRKASLLAVVGYAVLLGPALAQQAAVPPGIGKASPRPALAGPEEIVVTAQRRTERLSRTPVAVSVISAATLAKAQVTSQADLRAVEPGLQVRATTSSNDLNYALRGQSLDPDSAGRPGVLPYFNDVQIGGEGSASAFYDLQSVQVLKGPQGTLFGRNATGGAVLFTSAKPTNDVHGYFSAGGGTFDTGKVEGALSGPIIKDVLTARIAGFFQTTGGYQRNLFNGQEFGNADRSGGRVSLTYKNDRFQNDLVADIFHARGTNTVPTLASIDTNGAFPASELYTNAVFPAGSGPLTGQSVSDFVLSQILEGDGIPAAEAQAIAAGNYARFIAKFGGNPAVPAGGIAAILAAQNARGPYQIDTSSPNNFRVDNTIITDTAHYDVNATTQVKNIFGYTHLNTFQNTDTDGTPFIIGESGPKPTDGDDATTIQYSDEVQALGKAVNDNLSYVTGFYYSNEKTSNIQNSTFFDIILGGASQRNDTQRNNKTYAGYAQATYNLSGATGINGFSVTGGIRYTDEDIQFQILPTNAFYDLALTDPSVYSNDQHSTYKNVGYTVGLQEQLDPNLLLYATSRRSYKNGGYNNLLAPKVGFADTNGDAYATETLTDIEVGGKFQGRIADVPTRVNVAAFNDFIDNSQRTAFTLNGAAPAAFTANVPKADVYGVEIDGQAQLLPWLGVGASADYTHSRFTDGNTFVAGKIVPFETYPDTPSFAGSAFVDVTLPLRGNTTVLLHADEFGQTSAYYSSSTNLDPGTINPGYYLTDFRVGLQNEVQGWAFTVNIKNAFDKVYYVGGLPLGQLLQIDAHEPGSPRTVFAELRYTF